jgi:hypothetical protein
MEGDSKPQLALPRNMELWQSAYSKDPTLDIVIPCRSQSSLETAPVEQRVAETGENLVLNEILRHYGYKGEILDIGWGPRAVRKRAMPFFVQMYYRKQNGSEVEINDWGHPYVAMVEAANYGMRFGGIILEAMHPPQRTVLEEGNPEVEKKRIRTFEQIAIESLRHFHELHGESSA